jgi:hypothetical protein
MRKGFCFFVATGLSFTPLARADHTIEHPEWKSYFETNGVEGTVVVADLAKDETTSTTRQEPEPSLSQHQPTRFHIR